MQTPGRAGATIVRRAAVLVLLVIATGALAGSLGWAGYAAVAWLGYGRLQVDRRPDALLDRYQPAYEVAERHEIRVAAPANVAYAAVCAMDLQRSPVVRAIFRGREVLLRAPHGSDSAGSILTQTLRLGWGVLDEVPGREIVVGAVTKPWEPQVVFRALPRERFAAFDSAGYAKIVWTLAAEPLDDSTSLVSTTTRVRTTDAESRRRFRRYWSIFSPGILLIRRSTLPIVRADAEARHRATRGAVVPAAPCPR